MVQEFLDKYAYHIIAFVVVISIAAILYASYYNNKDGDQALDQSWKQHHILTVLVGIVIVALFIGYGAASKVYY